MKKETFNLVIRFLVGLALSMLICAGMILLGRVDSSKPLIQQASGLKGSDVVLTVDGEAVQAWEYLYMTSYTAQSLSYYGITDLDTLLGEEFTAADYVKEQVESQVTQQAVIRKWAKDEGITLTGADKAAIQEQKDVNGADLQKALKLNGLTEEQYDRLMETSMLYRSLYVLYCGEEGAKRPDDAALNALAEEHGLMTADVLFISTTQLDDAAKADAKALMADYARVLREAGDKAAAFAALEVGENVTVNAAQTYDGCEETTLNTALAALKENEVSGVIEDESGFYVALRRAVDLNAVAEVSFGEEMSMRIAAAQVEYNESVSQQIDIAAYYTRFSEMQQQLYTQMMADETQG